MTCSRRISAWLAPRQRIIGAAVEMALQIAPRRERDRRRREQDGGEHGEIQKALGAVERGANLGPRIAHALHALAGGEPRRHPCAVGVHRRGLARDLQAVAHAAARLYESGRGEVGGVQHEARLAAQKAERHARFLRDDRGDPQLAVADARRVAPSPSSSPV